MFIKQSTLKKSTIIYGIGLHSGKKIKLKLTPGKENSGIIFRRIDLKKHIDIPALITNVINTQFSTTIGKNEIYIKTIEHLLSAIFTLKIDNILIEINSEEIPIMDGSAYPFIYLLKSCGIKLLNKPKRFLKAKKESSVRTNNRVVLFFSSNHLDVFFCFKNKTTIFDFFYLNFNLENYILSISNARTFGFYNTYSYLLFYGFVKGVKLNNVLVFHNNQIFNKNLIRYDNENIKHKILDFLGDISLLGKFIIGSFFGTIPGHSFNNNISHHLLFDSDSYDLVLFHKYYGFTKF